MNKHRIWLATHLESTRELPALIDAQCRITYGEYHRYVNTLAAWLKDKGIEKQQPVAIVAANSIEYVLTVMALLNAGAIACLINPRFPRAALVAMLVNIGCRTAIMSPDVSVELDNIDILPMVKLDELEPGSAAPGEMSMEQDATIIFTSGTSAEPKAVLHSFGNHHFSALGANDNIELKPGDCWLLSLPLYHVGGLGIVFRCLMSGGAVAVPDRGESLSDAVRRLNVTHLSLVPTQLEQLLQDPTSENLITRIKSVLVGGGFVPQDLIEQAVGRGLKLHTTYGSTEMASQVTTTAADDAADKLFTSGRVLKYREVKVGDSGEIMVRGETLFKGYVTSSGLNPARDEQGWFATGDLGRIDSEGYLHVTGRMDNMFISGGENIHPEEIEAVMLRLPGVEDVVVVAVDDEKFGQRPVAFVKFASGVSPAAEKLQQQLGNWLPKFKIPAQILDWPDEPAGGRLKRDRQHFQSLARGIRL